MKKLILSMLNFWLLCRFKFWLCTRSLLHVFDSLLLSSVVVVLIHRWLSSIYQLLLRGELSVIVVMVATSGTSAGRVLGIKFHLKIVRVVVVVCAAVVVAGAWIRIVVALHSRELGGVIVVAGTPVWHAEISTLQGCWSHSAQFIWNKLK